MSLKTEDSLNCPCNGIYKCGFHSAFKLLTNPYTKEEMDKFFELYNEIGTTPHFISPCVTPPENITWPKLHLAIIDSKEFD